MGNIFGNGIPMQFRIANFARIALIAASLLGFFGMIIAQGQTTGSASSGVTNALCNVFLTVRNVIFLLGLTLMILGAALYAGANMMPGSQKGGIQGYGMGMIVGGVIGVAIAIASPYILNLLVSSGGAGAQNVFGSSTATGSTTIQNCLSGTGSTFGFL